ncbi:hypothetical protein C84B14_09822 [Salinisphaera sp. C84B14]|uniref:hypothetical protein n=1 Tax=Salinisphaera sp. C84B14 TaxID=1304155 RepID=UPI003341FD18
MAAPALSDAAALLARNQNSGLHQLFSTLSKNARRHWPVVSFNRFKAVGRGVRAFANARYQPEKSSIE